MWPHEERAKREQAPAPDGYDPEQQIGADQEEQWPRRPDEALVLTSSDEARSVASRSIGAEQSPSDETSRSNTSEEQFAFQVGSLRFRSAGYFAASVASVALGIQAIQLTLSAHSLGAQLAGAASTFFVALALRKIIREGGVSSRN